jgi:hypothetical protein
MSYTRASAPGFVDDLITRYLGLHNAYIRIISYQSMCVSLHFDPVLYSIKLMDNSLLNLVDNRKFSCALGFGNRSRRVACKSI